MANRLPLRFSSVALLLIAPVCAANEPLSATHFEDEIRPVLMKYCADCHHPEDDDAPAPFLAAKSVHDVSRMRSLWQSAAEQLTNRTMPPPDEAQPSEEERLQIAHWIEETMRTTACDLGEFAGPVTTRRLNRVEYDNTIRDLLGVELDASSKFPVDGSGGEGFNNNGETLFLSDLLMERYLEAASVAVDQAVITKPFQTTRTATDLGLTRDGSVIPLAGKKQVGTSVVVYRDADYRVRLATAPQAGSEIQLKLDGINVGNFKAKPTNAGQQDVDEGKADTAVVTTTIRLTRGVHRIAIRVASDDPVLLKSFGLEELTPRRSEGQLRNHEQLIGLKPGVVPQKPAEHARSVLAKFMRRAFRRPVSHEELNRYLQPFSRGLERGDPFDEAIKLSLKSVLVSPHFLFRIEQPAESEQPVLLDQHALAVRLSYFLWSSMPDDELNRLTDAGRLSDSEVLRKQVDRMLNDPKADAFATQFVGQWLGTEDVGARVAPSTDIFKSQFTTELLLDMRDEPVWFFAYLLEKDRPLLDLLDADYAIVTKRLARHYGMTGEGPIRASGNGWTPNPQSKRNTPPQVLSTGDLPRGGLLGMGGVHMRTSYPNRTSPVLRGAWVLETLLGVHVPSPPPDVPELKRGRNEKRSLREQLAKHRENTSCSACHNLMDPLGFALENFDVLGRWRTESGKTPIDATAKLPSGERFEGPEGLKSILMQRKDQFTRHLTRKMLGYAIGRSLADADDCTIDRITANVIANDYRARELVHQIVQSTPFRMHQSAPTAAHSALSDADSSEANRSEEQK